MFLDNLIQENQYPIIFAGAGLTKRYYSDAPSWPDLIKTIWSETLGESSYYDRYFSLKEEYPEDNFAVLTHLAQELESEYNRAFSKQELTLPNLTISEYYETEQSPFKTRIANVFTNLTPRESTQHELPVLKSMLKKARFIVTTNYDMLIETLLTDDVKVNIGNAGLFQSTNEYGELYKIHGSVADPNSIIITNTDYQNIEKTNTLVNAKILSKLTESPIVFVGYSLTDKNIKSLLSDLSSNMPYSMSEAAKRIGVIAHAPSENKLVETLNSLQYDETTITFTEIKTDNYASVYSSLATIKQGLSPNEIRKFQGAIKSLILSGSKNDGAPVLVSSVDLDTLGDDIGNKNIAVAIASSDTINNSFGIGIPDYVDYIRAYFLEHVPDFRVPLALDFIGSKSSEEIIPIAKIISLANEMNLQETYAKYAQLKIKVADRNNRRPSLDDLLSGQSFVLSSQNENKFQQLKDDKLTPVQMYESQVSLGVSNTTTAIKFITRNIQEFTPQELSAFTEHLLNTLSPEVLKKSEYRRYFLAYSFTKHPNPVNLL